METLLNVAVIDDEPLAREVLEGYLKRLTDIGQILLFPNAMAALKGLKGTRTQLLLLDIEMPEMSGIEFLKQLTKPPLTIFTTAYRNYAFEGYELGVIDFLLKPISFNRFEQAITKARELMALKEHSHLDENLANTDDFIFVKSGLQRIKLQFNDVTHIQGLKDYAIIHTPAKKILLKGSIKAMQDLFPPDRFLRVHKSFIINLQKIQQLDRNGIFINDQQVPIGRNFREALEKFIKIH